MLWQKYNENHKHPHIGDKLESTDAAPKVPQLRPTRDAASDVVTRLSDRAYIFFFFFFCRIRADSARFVPMRLDSCRIGFDSRQTGLIRPKSSHIGHIGSYRLAADTAETGRKMAEIRRKRSKSALNMAGKSETCILLSFFFESRHSMCFLKIF